MDFGAKTTRPVAKLRGFVGPSRPYKVWQTLQGLDKCEVYCIVETERFAQA